MTSSENLSTSPVIGFDNSYARLPERFFEKVNPSAVAKPSLIAFNQTLAETLNLDAGFFSSESGVQVLAGNRLLPGAEPIAMAYAGHQFGNFVPQLGDGRAILLGEVLDKNGERFDIQLKGAGRTPFSRGGDGRNWVGPVMREYLVSEAMAAMRIPTTRALAAARTGDHVLREAGPMPGAIVTRVARSHVRVGTFQFFTARQDEDAVNSLMQYVIARHFPHILPEQNQALALLDAVIERQARLVAQWQSVGFIHGVMNTDNCSITGDTIDYGPCAFIDTYRADKVFSSIDHGARYAYQNQPRIAQWNLVNLAQCLLPLIDEGAEKAVELAQESINRFDEIFIEHYMRYMRPKLGLSNTEATDLELIDDLLNQMEQHELDFTQSFWQLSARSAIDQFAPGGTLHDWYLRLQERWQKSGIDSTSAHALMLKSNPLVIPRNHQIEAVIQSAVEDADDEPFHALLKAVTSPYDQAHANGPFTRPPTKDQVVAHTFCGT